jgi:hypothetical protein
MTRPLTQHDTADLHPSTVTDYSRGAVAPVHPRGRRPPAGSWDRPRGVRIPAQLLSSSLVAAGGDPNRLWFALDGSVYVLNHTRATACPSPACPACDGGRRTPARSR